MKKMKLRFLFTIFGFALLFFSHIKAQTLDALKIGTDGGYPPYTYINEQGELVGFEIDLGKAVCKAMNVQCEFVQLEYQDLMDALNRKEVDIVMAGLSANDRYSQLGDPSIIYIQGGARFLKLKTVRFERGEGSWKNKRVGFEEGGFRDYINTYKGHLVGVAFPTIKEALNALERGEVDLVIGDLLALDALYLGYRSKFEAFGPEVYSTYFFGDGQAAYFRKEDDELKKIFNEKIKYLRFTRVFQKISIKYFDKDIFPN